MKENILQKKLIIMASELGHRLFRHNIGMGWAGESIQFSKPITIQVYPGDVLIRKAFPLRAGLVEFGSDLIGFSSEGKFIAIETKTEEGKTDKKRLEGQMNFIKQVNNSGGIAGIASTEEEGFNLLNS